MCLGAHCGLQKAPLLHFRLSSAQIEASIIRLIGIRLPGLLSGAFQVKSPPAPHFLRYRLNCSIFDGDQPLEIWGHASGFDLRQMQNTGLSRDAVEDAFDIRPLVYVRRPPEGRIVALNIK